MKAFVTFVCERLPLAVVAIGGVFMLVVFVIVEVHATQIGYYPFHFESNADSVQVPSGTSLGGALQTGDRIDLERLTPQQRFSLLSPASDSKLTVLVRRGDRTFPVALSAIPPDYSERATLARDIGIPLSFFLSLGLASALLLMRPRPITLAFYGYTILMLLKVYESPLALAAWPMNFVSDLAIQAIYPAAQLMILIFAQRLYGRPSQAWRWIFGTALALSALALVVWIDPIVWMVYQRFGLPGPTRIINSLVDVALLVTVLCGLAYIASGATAVDRKRVTWMLAGIALAPILDLTWAVQDVISALIGDASNALTGLGIWTDALGPWFGLIGVALVFYGFVSQRVVDFRFVAGRAVVYGSVTIVLVFLFGVIEWWAEQVFESTRPAVYVSLGAALLIGFALKTLHGRIEEFISTVLFHEQHRAEEALARASRALAGTSSEKTVTEFLIGEPVRVLGLTSAALFLTSDEGRAFVLTASEGWNPNRAQSIDAEDPLVVALRADRLPVDLDGRQLTGVTSLHGDKKSPSFIIPLMMRGRLFGLVFYGCRRDGLPLSAIERSRLETLATAASAAFDHIDADRSRVRIALLEDRLHEFGVTLSQDAPAR